MTFDEWDPDRKLKQTIAETVVFFLMLAFLAGFVSAL